MLEKEVDEKYYLSEKAIQGRANSQFNQYKLERNIVSDKDVHPTILARYEGAPTLIDETKSELKSKLCKELLENGLVEEGDVIRHSYTNNRLNNGVENMSRTESKEKLSPTLDTRCDCLGVVVKEPSELQKEVCNQAMEKGLMTPYDIIDYTYSNARLGEIMNGKLKTKNSTDNQIANTLTCNVENMGVCVPGEINVVGNYSPSGHEASRIVHPDGVAPTIKENHGTITATVEPNLRIRKLTPKECWRLMGFADEDVEKAAKVCSNSQLYKQAGNSIVVNVLMAIFKELFVPKQTRSQWLDELLGGV
jgi:DNA (cytosine-5)-methyltransferase 1